MIHNLNVNKNILQVVSALLYFSNNQSVNNEYIVCVDRINFVLSNSFIFVFDLSSVENS